MKKYNEFSLIEKIKKDFSFQNKNIIGIGDDCAFLKKEKNLIITTDTLVENKHFIFEKTDFFLLGKKSLSVNLSDIAAMGGIPLYFLLTLGIPPYMEDSFIEKFLDGLKECAIEYKTKLIGGDCVASNNFFVSITLLGKTLKKPILRSNAKINDYIYTTGKIGDSSFGLSILLNEEEKKCFKDENYFVKKHLNPTPRIKLMKKLSGKYKINSAIDISDGLLGDLIHIAEESKCGFEIFIDKIPISKEKISNFQEKELEYILKAISGGEDYEIIFTSPDIIKEKEITNIGRITDSGFKLFYKDKELALSNIKNKSFIHF